jgi:predicted amidophosphoribosyltransferase
MAACTSCGAELPDGARFCASCGAAVAEHQAGEMLKLAMLEAFTDVAAD